jgi:hypothetical protein
LGREHLHVPVRVAYSGGTEFRSGG